MVEMMLCDFEGWVTEGHIVVPYLQEYSLLDP